MIPFELKRVLKEGVIILFILAILMVRILTTEGDPLVTVILLEIFLLLYASFCGWSLFDRERQEGAIEYLLSLPVSRTRLFFLKFTPRLFSAVAVLGAYLLMHHWFRFPSVITPLQFSIFYFAFFLVSLSFSLNVKSFIAAIFLTAFFSIGFTYLLGVLDPMMTEASAITTGNLVMLVFPVTFFIVFRTYDIKPLRAFNIKFLPPVLVILGVTAGLTWSGSDVGWGGYYITAGGDLVRSSHGARRAEWIKKWGEPKLLYRGCGGALLEKNGILYLHERKVTWSDCRSRRLSTLNLKTGEIHPVMDVQKGWEIGVGHTGKGGAFLNGNYYNLIYNKKEKKSKIIKSDGSKVKTIPLYGNFYDEFAYSFVHATDAPRWFLVLSGSRLYRASENGEAEEMFPINGFRDLSDRTMMWGSRIARFNQEGMTVYDFSGDLTPVLKMEGDVKKVRRKWSRPVSPKFLIRVDKRNYFILDLESLERTPIHLSGRPYYYTFDGDVLHGLWVSGDTMIYRKMKKGKVVKEKKKSIGIKELRFRRIMGFPTGVVISNPLEYQVFRFDM